MEPCHIDEITPIERASFPDPWRPPFFRGIISDPSAYCTVASLSERIVGYLVLYRVLDEGEIYNIATAGEFLRMGIGSALLRDSITFCGEQGIKKIHLEVRSGNSSAIAMYKKAGFTGVGLRRGYYKSPREDAVIMTYTY